MDGRSDDDTEAGLSETPTGRLPDVPPRPRTGSGSLDVEVEGQTHPGQVRDHNEDSYAVEPPTSGRARAHGTLLVVSDGMGGHAAGEVASGIAVQTIPATFYRGQGDRARARDSTEVVVEAILAANATIYEEAERNPGRLGMGCTVVVAVVRDDDLTVGHVGDSRIYLIRRGQIRQLTRDHSWIAQQVAAGVLTPEQAEHHPRRSLLLQALGREPTVQVDVARHALQAGDVVLLCSDGLTGVVHDAEIADLVTRLAPRAAVERLIALANERGAPDNVTVVVAVVDETATERLPAVAPGTIEGPATEPRIVPGATAERATIQPLAGQPTGSRHDTAPMAAPAPSTDPPPRDRPSSAGRAPDARRAAAPAPASTRRRRGPLLTWALAAVSLLALATLPFLIQRGLIAEPAASPTPTSPSSAARPAEASSVAASADLPPPIPTGLPGLAASPAAAAPAAAPSPIAPATAPPTATSAPSSSVTPTSAPAPEEPTATPPPPGQIAPSLPAGVPGLPPIPTDIPTGIPGLPPLRSLPDPRRGN